MTSRPRRTAVIVNPRSANGKTGQTWDKMRRLFQDRVGPGQIYLTQGPNDATRLAQLARLSGAETIVSVGGDGTLNEIINGCLDKNGVPDPDLVLGVIPLGGGCDLARSLGLPRNPEAAIDCLTTGRIRRIDLGRMTFRSRRNTVTTRYFHNVVSFGLGGEVDEKVNAMRNFSHGAKLFLWATLTSVLRYRKKGIRLKVDGRALEVLPCWNVAVANGEYHGAGMCIAPGAELNDGLFQVTVIGDLRLVEVFLNLPKLYNRNIYTHPMIHRLTGKRIEAFACEPVSVDMDGEALGRLPLLIEMLPSAISVITAD